MTGRVKIGSHLGGVGIFISRPGDDVENPTQPLIVDSRFDSLSVHATGYVEMPVISQASGRRWQGAWTFPALSYLPMYWYCFVSRGGDNAYYPMNNMLTGEPPSNYTASLSMSACTVDTTTVRAFARTITMPNDARNMQLYLKYIIFRNAR